MVTHYYQQAAYGGRDFAISQSPCSIQLASHWGTPPVPSLCPPAYKSTVARGMQGLGDISTFFSDLGIDWHILVIAGLGGYLAYRMFFSSPAKKRRSALAAERKKYRARVRAIKAQYAV
jgi:hypothetical protein